MGERTGEPEAMDEPSERDTAPAGSATRPLRLTAPGRTPAFVVAAHRTLLGCVLVFYFFIVFCAARGLLGGWGLPLSVLLPAVGATVVMATFVVWLAPLLDLPEMWYRHHLPSRRLARGLCPECGYARPRTADREHAERQVCPECGADDTLPPAWQLDWSTFRRFLVLLVIAIVVGATVGAIWLRQDEHAFFREAERRGTAYERPRVWPAEFAQLRYDEELGFTSTTVLESEPIYGWKPRERED